jgi:hypothetical protein
MFSFLFQMVYIILSVLELKTFRDTFLVQPGSAKGIFHCLCKGKGKIQNIITNCHSHKDCTCDTNFTFYPSHHDSINFYVIFL